MNVALATPVVVNHHSAPPQIRDMSRDRVWQMEPEFLESFDVDQKTVNSFLEPLLLGRCFNLCCCVVSVPVFGQIFGLLPPFVCVFGAHIEYLCGASAVRTRQSTRKVALTARGIKIRSQGKAGDNYGEAVCNNFDQPFFPFMLRRMDQFYVDEDFEKDAPQIGKYKYTRMLYYDQIRSATMLGSDDQVYQQGVGCCCWCCGHHVNAKDGATKNIAGTTRNMSFVRIDIGKEDGPTRDVLQQSGGQYNPVIIGLQDPLRFCDEVNKRARGGQLHGSSVPAQVAVLLNNTMAVPTPIPVAVPVQNLGMGPKTSGGGGGGQKGSGNTLAGQLERLKDLFDSGAIDEDEYTAAKRVAIQKA